MDRRILLGAAGAAVATIALGQLAANTVPGGPESEPAPASGVIGPDVITGDLPSVWHWIGNETEQAYSFGTTSCNVGDEPLAWIAAPSTQHPVISQNIFRLADGRFEQIGQSWLKHGFCAVQRDLCGTCEGPGGCIFQLFPMCSDPYTAYLNGTQNGLGPKWQVNAHTGVFAVPWDEGAGTGNPYNRRLRVKNADIDAGGRFFIEGMYVTRDDAAWGNQNNNASYREVEFGTAEEGYPLRLLGETQRTKPAILAWADHDADVAVESVQIEVDGRFLVGCKVTDNEDGTWTYEYAVQNQNAHRSARVWSVPVPTDAIVSGVGFSDVDYQGGDGINGVDHDGTDWPPARDADSLAWSTDAFGANENANALRWGTLYNFRFTADAPPATRMATLGLYRPGTPGAVSVSVLAPSSCPADIDGSGDVDFQDILAVLDQWGNAGGSADVDGSGFVDFDDLLLVLDAWGPCE